jgi:DNA-3-methyladenine glycosylase II
LASHQITGRTIRTRKVAHGCSLSERTAGAVLVTQSMIRILTLLLPLRMPTTRSNSARRLATKRKATASPTKADVKKSRTNKQRTIEATGTAANNVLGSHDVADTPVPAVLSFSFQEAKQHLVNVDDRFQDLFDRLSCKPFEHLEQVHPFR